jgi:phospholipase C
MLENRSFDHIFGFSGLPGIDGLKGDESNTYNGTTYTVSKGAKNPMTTDSAHEFFDTMEQLCGTKYGPKGINPFPAGPYPPIDNSGVVANYATTVDEDTGLPARADYGDVMKCCAPEDVPVIIQLAQEFAICDRWYASIPGATWPNRLFAMGASSSGLDDTPSTSQIAGWETPWGGIEYVNGSIFDLLTKNDKQYRLYNDWDNNFANPPASVTDGGQFPMVSALYGISWEDIHYFSELANDLHYDYPYQFTFIEPHYGDAVDDTYVGGSSQHPEDCLAAGEALIAATYNAIRNSPLWDTSLLIVTYDEHGGFYDHSTTPRPATPPGDNPQWGYNLHGFDFSSYGPRVPAVVISPLIPKGTVCSNLYDHTSMLRTVEDINGLPQLTNRDASARGLTGLLTEEKPRTDCPLNITAQVGVCTAPQTQSMSIQDALADPTPLVEKGNVIVHLQAAVKTDIELAGHDEVAAAAIITRAEAIKTRGQARAYFAEVSARVRAAKKRGTN